MPTRDEFLANPGLVPQDGDYDCTICYETANDPVTTGGCRCRVMYCRECILSWFGVSGTCPICRTDYYDPADTNPPTLWQILERIWNELTFWEIYDAIWETYMMLMRLYIIVVYCFRAFSQVPNPRVRPRQ